jgi:hypothetical protein
LQANGHGVVVPYWLANLSANEAIPDRQVETEIGIILVNPFVFRMMAIRNQKLNSGADQRARTMLGEQLQQ